MPASKFRFICSQLIMDVTSEKRSVILALKRHSNKSNREIARIVKVCHSTVTRIINRTKRRGTSSPQRTGKCGRKRKTTPRDECVLLRESKKYPRMTSHALRLSLLETGIEISDSTVRKRLLEKGRPARRPKKKQLLTQAMKKKRYDWAKKHKHWTAEDWRKVIFSDESHFLVQGQRFQHVRRSHGEPVKPEHIQQSVKHPEKKMFWGCFSYHGVGPLQPVDGMMRSDQYIDILSRRLVPEMRKTFPLATGIFQHDLAPCHTSKKVQTFFRQKKITVLDWPGNSPDLSPIENLWSIIKTKLRAKDCTTQQKLICAIIDAWYRDSTIADHCQKLVDSMPKRIQQVLKNKGGHISY